MSNDNLPAEKKLACEGDCLEHSGEVRAVNVKHIESKHDWGKFNYCDEAVKEDCRRGMEVTEL